MLDAYEDAAKTTTKFYLALEWKLSDAIVLALLTAYREAS